MTTKPAPVAAPDEGIPSDTRRVIRRTVLDLRKRLEDDFRRQLAAWGISERGVSDAPKGLNEADARSREIAAAVIERERVVAGRGLDEAIDFFISECAFTFLNRAYGLRCLEERKLLIVDGQTETAIHTDASSGSSSLYWRVRNSDGAPSEPRELWRATLRQACDAVAQQVRVLFDSDAEEAALFPLLPTVQAVVVALNDAQVPAETYATDELLGWVYQYFNSERKDEVFAAAGKGKKIEGEDIVPATQIYTERYMVDFLLQNSLGRTYREMYPDTKLPRWPYELTPHPDNPKVERDAKPLAEVTIMDPAVGSGHFLLRAADLLFAMYEEQQPEMPRDEVALSILEHNLYGIDLDLRAVQIAALALYMKASTYAGRALAPQRINLVAADVQLPPAPPKEYLDRFQGDAQMEGLVNAMWESLRSARELGSLIHPERAVDDVMTARQARYPLEARANTEELDQFKRDLFHGLRDQIEASNDPGDVGGRLLGDQTARGIDLVAALAQQYDIVCANPPYMGSKNMGSVLKGFIQRNYVSGKRDLYAAFILRCLQLARPNGVAAMVTQQSWMFLSSYSALRGFEPDGPLGFQGLLRESVLEYVAHLGPGSFGEVGGEVVSTTLFVARTAEVPKHHRTLAIRATAERTPDSKRRQLAAIANGAANPYFVSQVDLLLIPEAPFMYWLPEGVLAAFKNHETVGDHFEVVEGLHSGDDERYVRCFWETSVDPSWTPYLKQGGFGKWSGLDVYVVNWKDDGRYLRTTGTPIVPNERHYFAQLLGFSRVAQGAFCVRYYPGGHIFSSIVQAIVGPDRDRLLGLTRQLNSFVGTYFLRCLSANLDFNKGYVMRLPHAQLPADDGTVEMCLDIQAAAVRANPLEREFREASLPIVASNDPLLPHALTALRHLAEGLHAALTTQAFQFDEHDVAMMMEEVGIPVGQLPLLAAYDAMPDAGSTLPSAQLVDFLGSLERRELLPTDITRLRSRLAESYAGLSSPQTTDEDLDVDEDSEPSARPKRVPFDSHLERLSEAFGINPVSCYWLLEETSRNQGLIRPGELRRQVEDYLSVQFIRMLGYRWPIQEQYEKDQGSPFIDPKWVDEDGIIPLTVSAGQRTIAQRLHDMLHDEFGEDAEAELCSTLGWKPADDWGKQQPTTLERWFEREFFKRHVQQFKQRPIAWHFKSPEGHFQAFVLYHKLSYATLEKLRSTYAGATIQQLRAQQERAKSAKDDKEALALQAKIEDVEAFRETIEKIQRGDVDGAKPTFRIRCRWKGEDKDGRPGPYAPDIDDGVKVNIRPFQEAGLLASKVINKW